MFDKFIDTIRNFDLKIKKILISGLYFSLFVSIIGALILTYYISFSHSNFIYYIGIEVIHLSISFAVSFLASAFAIDKIKKDFV